MIKTNFGWIAAGLLSLFACTEGGGKGAGTRRIELENPQETGQSKNLAPARGKIIAPALPPQNLENATLPKLEMIAYAFTNNGYEEVRTLPAIVAMPAEPNEQNWRPFKKVEVRVKPQGETWQEVRVLDIAYSNLPSEADIWLVPAKPCEVTWRLVENPYYDDNGTIETSPWSEPMRFDKAYVFRDARDLLEGDIDPAKTPSVPMEQAGGVDLAKIMTSLVYMNKYELGDPRYITWKMVNDALNAVGFQDGEAMTEDMARKMPEAMKLTQAEFLDRIDDSINWSVIEELKRIFSQ